jgi:hypothetical protein
MMPMFNIQKMNQLIDELYRMELVQGVVGPSFVM